MRDPEILISLLRELANTRTGYKPIPATLDADPTERHHAHLLVDAGHATWNDLEEQILRITNDGYDFLNAIDSQPDAKSHFLEMLNSGLPYVNAALETVKFVGNLGIGS